MGKKRKRKRTEEESIKEWVGRPLTQRGDDKYYRSVKVDETELHMGDFVSVIIIEKGKETVSYACIETMWEDREKFKWVEVRWLYRPEETKFGKGKRGKFFSEDELFDSDWTEDIEIDALNSKITILSEEMFKRMAENNPDYNDEKSCEEDNNMFFIRYFYSPVLAQLRKKVWTSSKGHFSKRLPANLFKIGGTAAHAGRQGISSSSDKLNRKKVKNNKETLANNSISDNADFPDEFRKVYAELQLSAVPVSLPCREKERDEIYNFLYDSISRATQGGCLYVSGMPGTGKTATVMECIASLERLSHSQKLHAFNFVEINGMKLKHPYEAYTLLHKAITGEHRNPARAAALLETRFSSPRPNSHVCVVLVDEIDYLVNRKQKVLYNLFDWPSRSWAKLVVIAIANTMDLPERLLPRVHSRLGMSRVVFQSYNEDQVQKIVKARLGNIPLFKDEAVEFCSRKVAARCGDVRRALQICRRAAEIWEQEGKETKILIRHIKRADEELRDELHNKRIQVASWNEKLVLIAAYKVSKITGKDVFSFEDLFFKFQHLRKTYFFERRGNICEKRILSICRRLGRIRLFTLTKEQGDRRPHIRLSLDPEEIQFIYRNETEFAAVLGLA